MDFLFVGNEQWETQYLDLTQCYGTFEATIHAKYPDDCLEELFTPLRGMLEDYRKKQTKSEFQLCRWMGIIMSVRVVHDDG